MSVNDQPSAVNHSEYEAAARALKVNLKSMEVDRNEPDIESAFQRFAATRVSAVIIITSATLFLKQKLIADLATKNRLPTMFQGSTWVDSGGLMSYSTNDLDATRRAATYVDKILKGTRPVNLPVEQSIKYEMVINVWGRAPRSGIWTCFYYPEPVKF